MIVTSWLVFYRLIVAISLIYHHKAGSADRDDLNPASLTRKENGFCVMRKPGIRMAGGPALAPWALVGRPGMASMLLSGLVAHACRGWRNHLSAT